MRCGFLRDGIAFFGILFQLLLCTPGSDQFSQVIIQHPETDNFMCVDGTSIPSKYKCDYHVDCKNGEDERNCAGSCDFEKDTCGYNDGSSGTTTFLRTQANTKQLNGPTSDHTSNTSAGYFIITDGVTEQKQKSYLQSPKLPVTSPQCIVEFSYYYTSSEKGTIAAGHKQQLGREDIESVIWWKELTRTTKWQRAAIAVEQRPDGWSLFFTVDQNHVAIDDIFFRNCSYPRHNGTRCNSNQFKCGNGPCISSTQRCDFSRDCLDGSDENTCEQHTVRCNFEDQRGCRWLHQVYTDDFDWIRRNGSRTQDHTTGTSKGHYLAVDASNHKQNEAATLLSILFLRSDTSNHEANSSNLLHSNVLQRTLRRGYTGACYLTFFYYMDAGYGHRLSVKRHGRSSSRGRAEVIKTFSDSGQGVARWSRAFVNLATDQSFKVIIEAKIGDGRNGVIAIDDVAFSPECQPKVEPCRKNEFACGDGQCVECTDNRCMCNFTSECKNKEDERKCFLCSFEDESKHADGMCGWKNDEDNNLQWSRHKGLTESNETGPPYDHTLKNPEGHYLYVDANQAQKGAVYNPRGRFVIATYNYTTSYDCTFSLWYNMYHKSVQDHCDVIVTINYTKWYEQTRDYMTTKLWEHSTTTYTQWKPVLLQLPRCPHNFSIVIETQHYWKSKTDIAIDDLKFNCTEQLREQQCDRETEYQCVTTKQCVPLHSVCDIDRNCCDGSDESEEICAGYTKMDFENGIDEGWKQLQNGKYDNFDFRLQNGKADKDFGPSWDHTFQEEHGTYIYIHASARVENQIAAIRSPTIKATNASSKMCRVRFWYNMYGHDMGSLRVYISVYYGEPRAEPVWSLSGNQGKEWMKASVQLKSEKDFQVIFNASVGSGPAGDIAIDDISFTPGCNISTGKSISGQPTKPPPNNCKDTQFSCRSTNTCIPRLYICDFHQDCAGGEDESMEQCGSPQGFENGLEPWMYTPVTNFDSVSFAIGNGDWQSEGSVSTTDASNYRSYIYFNVEKMIKKEHIAVLDSPWYQNSYGNCKLNLWYHMNVSEMFTMKVVLLSEGFEKEDFSKEENGEKFLYLFILQGNMGREWQEINITIGRRREKFKIRMSAQAVGQYTGVIAINSITFMDCDMSNDTCQDQFKCKNDRCIPKSRVCNFVDDCGDLSDEDAHHPTSTCYNYTGCNFETNSLCNFTQDKTTDDFDWSLNKGQTNSYNTGPGNDHTLRTKDGHYMYIEASPGVGPGGQDKSKPEGSKARLRSFPLTNNGGCIMMFYYHMYGEGVGQLNINVLFENGTRSPLKMFNDESKFVWREGVVDLSNLTGVFQVEFEGVVGASFESDIAIDDVLFNPQCGKTGQSIFPNIDPCPDKFFCTDNGNCAPKGSKCNGTYECKDKSDEPDNCHPTTSKPKHNKKQTDYVTVAALSSVLALLLFTTTAVIVVMKRRSAQKFHLFSIFYDPTANQGMDSRIVRQVSDVSIISAVSNPTYGSSASEEKEIKRNDKAPIFACGFHNSVSPSSSPVYQEPFYISKPNLH